MLINSATVNTPLWRWVAMTALVLLSGCQNVQSQSAAEPAAVCCGTTTRIPEIITVVGYAPISLQPGQNQQHKILMAMRASKLQAYQEMASVIHGRLIRSQSSMNDMVLQGDRVQSAVSGIVRGARVVKTYPVQDDVYATVLELQLTDDIQRTYLRM